MVGFGVVTWAQRQYRAPGPLTAELEVQVERGESLVSVTEKLADAGAIGNPMLFRISARYDELDAGLRYGDYRIPAGASMREILELLNRGGNVIRQVVVPEGLTSWQVVEMLNVQPELEGEVAEVPPEGALAPAGYDFQRGDERQAIIDRMRAEQGEIVAAAWAGRAPDLPLESPEELLTLASIVEKETGVAEERPLVASVFVNRLRQGMRLQTDPAVIYGITKGEGPLGRGLRASELATVTPYNTYAIVGLPPTPIANPGQGGDRGGGESGGERLPVFRRGRQRWACVRADVAGAQRQRRGVAADRGAAGGRGAGAAGGGGGGGAGRGGARAGRRAGAAAALTVGTGVGFASVSCSFPVATSARRAAGVNGRPGRRIEGADGCSRSVACERRCGAACAAGVRGAARAGSSTGI